MYSHRYLLVNQWNLHLCYWSAKLSDSNHRIRFTRNLTSSILTVSQFKQRVSLVKIPWNISCTHVGSSDCLSSLLESLGFPWLRSTANKIEFYSNSQRNEWLPLVKLTQYNFIYLIDQKIQEFVRILLHVIVEFLCKIQFVSTDSIQYE